MSGTRPFYIHEIHPRGHGVREIEGQLVAAHDYLGTGGPLVFETTGTNYEAPGFAAEAATESGWVHTLGEVMALANAGLRIDYLHEHQTTGF